MRISEFEYDVWDPWPGLIEDLRQSLSKYPKLFESTVEFQALSQFLADYTITPQVNEKYAVISLAAIPQAKFINLAVTSDTYELLEIKTNFYYFKVHDKIKQYPYQQSAEDTDLLRWTLLFRSLEEKEQFLTMVVLKFSGWNITTKKDPLLNESE